MVPMAPSSTRMRLFNASWSAASRAGRVAIGWSMSLETKNPSACESERVFGPIALAVFVERPQADDQIGAIEGILQRPGACGKPLPVGGGEAQPQGDQHPAAHPV